MGSYGSDVLQSPDQETPSSGPFDALEHDTSPLLDFDLEDGSFDWDNSGMIGDLPGVPNIDDTEHHDKRKKSTDEDEGIEGSGKRREGEEKGSARKPGRKPLTGEPTTKRKAQNRAAQRAFRERKERHLKDLEMKVEDLEKASESTNHENGRLRAQVERLNTEVKEYRKRLSLTAPGIGRSPPTASPIPYNSYAASNNDFQFAFPKFGDLPGSIFGSNGSLAKVPSPTTRSNPSFDRGSSSSVPSLARASSSRSPSTKSPVSVNGNSGSSSTGPNLYQSPIQALSGGSMNELNGLFSPSILESASRNSAKDYGFSDTAPSAPAAPRKSSSTDSYKSLANTPNFNANSTRSPSASSMSHGGQGSSCGTTPEPSADSPGHRKQSEGILNTINEESAPTSIPASSSLVKSPDPTNNNAGFDNTAGFDWMAQQNGGQFDPVLFNDYRDPQDNIMNGDFGDFFNDAFLTQDFESPFNTGEALSDPLQQPPAAPTATTTTASTKPDLMKEVEAAQNANDDPEVVPAEKPSFINCDKLWERVQASEKVSSGEVDMDDLCSQLKRKAKCTVTGAVIDTADLDKILGPISPQQRDKAFMKPFI
ncbi:AP-1-like transcription factor napA [Physcia stellaris]|nr:AP-1-like transcription factor napA [Physcia stellaris]